MLSAQPWNQTLLIAMTERIKKAPKWSGRDASRKPVTRDPLVASVFFLNIYCGLHSQIGTSSSRHEKYKYMMRPTSRNMAF